MFDKNKFMKFIKSILTDDIGENDMRATIIPTNNGKFQLLTADGLVGSYSRYRDASRGATRRGFILA